MTEAGERPWEHAGKVWRRLATLLGPRRTARDLTRELIEGLEAGTIVLPSGGRTDGATDDQGGSR